MSGRRQRAKSARAIASEEQQLVLSGKRRPSYTKPKYVEDSYNSRRSDTPTSARSRMSTPSSSRQPSRSPSPPPTGRRRSSINSAKTIKSAGRPKRGAVNSSGSNTPIGRGSRSSSVTSAVHHSRKSAAATPNTPKVKTKLGRGYNPSLVNYKESEYHYGSDFEDDGDEEPEEHVSEESSDDDDDDADSDDMKVESDVELDLDSQQLRADSRAVTPIPFWLRTETEEPPPPLQLPPSSDDLLVNPEVAFKAASTYEVLRHYRLLLRLSPFRFEDFCAALAAEEQSNLLSEIHIALLRSIIRAEEKDNTTFAPIDQKDSVNCLFFFMDSISWPYCLMSYLSTDPVAYAEPLQIMNEHKEYPMTSPPSNNWIECRVNMLSHLSDQFLATNFVREDIATEGAPSLEDHCRVCHRLGDMLVCDQCSGVFHLACLDPPLTFVPEDEWTCHICKANEVVGVTDCDNEHERSLTRHEALGFDRAGNKYWFVCRRIFVEGQDGSISYYTSIKQLEEVIDSLDPELYEADLCEAIDYMRSEIERQMQITEQLTNEKKAGSRKSYLELENAQIEKLQQERSIKREQEAEERRRGQEEVLRKAREEEDRKRKLEEEARAAEEEKKRKLREERLRKREESRGDAFPNSGDLPSDFEESGELKEEDLMDVDEIKDENSTEPEIKTETADHNDKPEVDVKPMDTSNTEIKEEKVVTSEIKPTPTLITLAPKSSVVSLDPANVGDLRLTRKTIQQLSTGTLYFKLGQENTYKLYVNQFSTNAYALSKVQATEERIKKTHLSHKFSLTDASTFKWLGALHGVRTQVLTTLRSTLLQLETSIPTIFLHVNWGLLRKAWINAVNTSTTPRDLARTLTVLQCCMKPCLMLTIWYESLGHTQLKKFTGQMKEDKKKVEKRERREKEEEEERLRPYLGFVKYPLGLKHQVAKQRGEEYRVHGQNGWLWLSATRHFCPSDMSKMGLRAGPHRLAVSYTDIRDKSSKIVLMEPNAFEYLLKKQDEMDLRKAMGLTDEEIAEAEREEAEKDDGKNKERQKLEQALKNARLARQVPDESLFADVVDVEDGLSKNTRSVFPKVGPKTKVLHDFLSRRVSMKNMEEKLLNASNDKPAETNEKTEALNRFVTESKKTIWSMVSKLKDVSSLPAPETEEATATTTAEPAQQVAPVTEPETVCYSPLCARGEANFSCYTVTCPRKQVKPATPPSTEQTATDSTKTASSVDSILQEASMFYSKLCQEATSHGMTLTYAAFTSRDDGVSQLQNLVKLLMQKKEEEDKKAAAEVAEATKTALTNGDVSNSHVTNGSNESKPSNDTTGKVYLKRLQTATESKNKGKEIVYPKSPSFHSNSRKRKNILILAKHDVRRLARKAGQVTAEGFNYAAKANYQVWPYPCPRPTFRTSWLYRTACLESLQAVGLQLRILWACLKWDDMQTKPPITDGKHQVTTDSAIMTTEILKIRNTGRFKEVTEYLIRKITIPLDVPRAVKEVTPIRSGLRKRKRAESPEQMEPKVTEEWVEEEKLELWEIRAFRDKQDREKAMSLTRSRTGTLVKEPQRLDPSAEANRLRQADMKVKMEEQLRLQREALQKKAGLVRTPGTPGAANASLLTQGNTGTPTIIRRINNPDGTVSLVRTVARTVVGPGGITTTPTIGDGPSAPKRIFVTKDGRVVQASQVASPMTPKTVGSPITIASPQSVQSTPVTPGANQKVQIVRSADGKIQVRGLLPGQQLIHTPDGKLQIVTQNVQQPKPIAAATTSTSTIVSTPPQVANQQQPSMTNRIIVQPNGQRIIISQQAQPQLPASPAKPANAVLTPGSTNQVIATQLAPGSQIPPNMTAFVSGGKTYCIPKATAVMAGANQTSISTTMTPSTVMTTQVATTTTTTPAAPATQPAKPMVEVKTLGQNVVTYKGNQIFVQGPDVAQAEQIARQLSTGAAKLGMLNGKQVLISTSTTVQQPQQQPQQQQTVVQQQTIAQPSPTLPQQILQSPVKADSLENVKLPTEPVPPRELNTSGSENQQPIEADNTVTKPPLQITAQLVQTAQGPKIILNGIHGASLPREYLLSIQQQVKTQLLKAQAEAKQQNRVPPTKIVIQLPPSIQAQLEKESNKPVQTMATPEISLPTTPVAPNALPAVRSPAPVINSVLSPRPLAPSATATTPGVAAGSPRPVVLQQILNSSPGQRFVLLSPSGSRMVVTGAQAAAALAGQDKSSMSIQLPTAPNPPSGQVADDKVGSTGDGDKFELTPDYIQKAISDALKTQNLSPEIEQKLLALQHHTSEKGVVSVRTHQVNSAAAKKALAPIDPLTGEPMDDEWEPTSRIRGLTGSRKRKMAAASSGGGGSSSSDVDYAPSPAPPPIMTRVASPAVAPTPAPPPQPPTLPRSPVTSPRSRSKSGQKPAANSGSSQAQSAGATSVVADEKRRQQALNKLQSMLHRHKEQLKKDIARKRSQQEKDLQIEIHREIEKAKADHHQSTMGYGQLAASSYEAVTAGLADSGSGLVGSQKRKRRDSSHGHHEMITASAATARPSSPMKKKKRTSSNSHAAAAGMVKKNKVYCVCKTKYDPSKFYVGCDVCNNWFHGNCVGISEVLAKTMSEYVCDECKSARENHEIYCLCRQPYDENQFYIGCEGCSDWFHGRCVGILQPEANNIDEYFCPRCAPNSPMNRPNSRPLSADNYELIKKIVKQLLVNRHSVPFKEPVNPSVVPNYYKVIKHPMDLQTIEDRVNSESYAKLSDFVGDVMRIFENCRFFNPPTSPLVKNAEALEAFFAQKLTILREKIVSGATSL